MDKKLLEAYSLQAFRAQAHQIVDLLADHLERSTSGRNEQALPWIEPADAVKQWAELGSAGATVGQLCEQLIAQSVHVSDPKYMGHQVCFPAPVAMIAGLITDTLNNGSGVYEMGMAGTAMEKFVVRDVCERFSWDDASDGFLTSGGTLGNLTALLAARARSCNEAWQHGTTSRLALMVSEQSHYCIDRAAKIMGWGDAGVVRVPVDANFRMRTDQLPQLHRQIVSTGTKVIAVVGSACTTSTGAFDDLTQIAKFCRDTGLWFHVDGAHGAAVAYSRQHRKLLAGIEHADSVVIDFHKMLAVPALCTAVLLRNGSDSFGTFSANAEYLFSEAAHNDAQRDHYNLARRTFECTKPMIASKIFSLYAAHGSEFFEQMVDRQHELATEFSQLVASSPGFELAAAPQSNIVCFRYRGDQSDDCKISETMSRVRERLKCEGVHYIVKTSLGGVVWLRCTFTNPFTSSEQMRQMLAVVESYAEQSQ